MSRRARSARAALVAVLLAGASAARARALLTQDEALHLAFARDAAVTRHAEYLTRDQQKEAARLAGAPIENENESRAEAEVATAAPPTATTAAAASAAMRRVICNLLMLEVANGATPSTT